MMDVEKENNGTAPFQEECNPALFFGGGGRGAILNDIEVALAEKVDLVTLIGEEGSGKTMFCKMLQEQQQTTHKVVLLPQLVGSFEDVVRVVAQECGFDYPADTNRADAKRIFLDLVASLQSRKTGLLLLCDEADTMYMATLERIRKILDEVNVQGGGLQVLLAGKKSLMTNLDQLTLCDFDLITEKQFFLSTLDDNETWNYLNFCVQASRGTEEQEVFTREAASKIASMGRGNLRMINMYADESLQSSNADTSFLVLLDHVKDGGETDVSIVSASGPLSKLSFSPKYILAGGVVVASLLLIFLYSGDDEKAVPELQVQQGNNPVFTNPAQESSVVIESTGEAQGVTEVNVLVVRESAKVAEEPAINPPVVQRTPVEISPVEIIEKVEVARDVPELTTQNIITAGNTKRIVNPQIVSQEMSTPAKLVVPSDVKMSVSGASKDPLLGKFIAAGDKWQTGAMDLSFSIQLMVLKSDQAEKNLKRIVSQPEYLAVSDKLVVLTRPSDPPAILVFYGVYPTMAAARNARNNMPIFLRDRHPYPVSVRGAVEKARAE